jgi:hypothetical protein
MGHRLIIDYADNFKQMILTVSEKKRPRQIIRIFEALQPDKVNHYQVERYWGLKMFSGIDLDKPGAPKKLLNGQRSYKRKQARADHSAIKEMLTKEKPPESRKKLKEVIKELGLDKKTISFDLDQYNSEPQSNFHEEE